MRRCVHSEQFAANGVNGFLKGTTLRHGVSSPTTNLLMEFIRFRQVFHLARIQSYRALIDPWKSNSPPH